MTTAPLSYDSLRPVLQYMEANQRFQLSRRVPSIRKTDEAVPLRIKYLKFDEMKTTINGTSYQMGIYWHYGTATPAFHQKINEDGGSKSELDRYGYWTCSDSFPLAEGDLNLTGTPLIIDSDIERFDEQSVRACEEACETLEEFLATNVQLSQITDIEPHSREALLAIIEDNRNSLASCRFDVEKYHLRRNNIDPPFTHFLQLTVKSPNGSKYIERMEYTGLTVTTRHERKHNEHLEYSEKKLYESMRYLNSLLFKQRKHAVLMKELPDFDARYVVRLPTTFKVKIKYLDAKWVPFNCFDKTIDPSSCPLAFVNVSSVEDLEHDFAVSAKKLVIENSVHNDDWLPTLLGLSNDCVILEVEDLPHQTYMEFIRNRLRNERPIGTRFSFYMTVKEDVEHLLNECLLFEGAKRRDRTVTVPMDGNSVLKVSYENVQRKRGIPSYYLIVEVEQNDD